MARVIGTLSAIGIKNQNNPGLYGDGAGLYLQVGPTLAKSWIFRFMLRGRARSMGLGALHTVSLADARRAAVECRNLLREGKDPIEARRERLAASASSCPIFRVCAEAYIAAHAPSWKNAKHRSQWTNTIETYAGPVFGSVPVDEVDLRLVLRVLEPIWSTKTETASRVRMRIEAILDWATVRGYRSGENPARWHGHLEAILPARTKVRKVKHHPALPYIEIPAFMERLTQQHGLAARALRFLVLTAARTGEVVAARWSVIDAANRIWTVPAERMKAGKEHRVPLTTQALSLLGPEPTDRSQPLFSSSPSRPLSNIAMLGRRLITA